MGLLWTALSAAIFTVMSWAPYVFVGWPVVETTQVFLLPQSQVVNYFFPALKEPGTGIGTNLMMVDQFQAVTAAYGLVGLFVGYMTYRLNVGWANRFAWLIVCSVLWFGGLYVLGGILSMGR